MAITSGGKAFFTNVDGGGTFYVQFNPKELKLEDTASWKQSDEQGQTKPTLTYEKGQPAVLSMDLIFDTTDTGGSVQGRIDALRAFLATSVVEQDEGGRSERPPHVDFWWKDFSFRGVIEKISASMLMFKADGTPLRAKVTVTMKERRDTGRTNTGAGNSVTLSSAGSIFIGAGVSARTTTVQNNQTATQIAAQNNTDVRTLAAANPQIEDLTNLNAGDQLVVPGNENLARVLQNQALAQSPVNFSPTGDLAPFEPAGNNDFGNIGNLVQGPGQDLSADFSTSGLADAPRPAPASPPAPAPAPAPPPVAVNEAQRRAHDALGLPDFDIF